MLTSNQNSEKSVWSKIKLGKSFITFDKFLLIFNINILLKIPINLNWPFFQLSSFNAFLLTDTWHEMLWWIPEGWNLLSHLSVRFGLFSTNSCGEIRPIEENIDRGTRFSSFADTSFHYDILCYVSVSSGLS